MNQSDRKNLADIIGVLEQFKSSVDEVASKLRDFAETEQEKFDNMPEGLQQSERGQEIESVAGSLNEAADACEQGNVGEALEVLSGVES